ncbi:MAG: SDR family NAD(P)-dependent oxidoreductase [Spartobacteria bacterium]
MDQAVIIIGLPTNQQQTAHGTGGMAAIAAPRVEVEAILADPAMDGIDVVVSGENSPRSTTVAGTPEGLAALQAALEPRGTGYKALDLPYAFHSPAMDSVVPGFIEESGEVSALPPSIPLFSTVTGCQLTYAPAGDYWAKNIREPVLFREAVECAASQGSRIFIEIGPHPVLSNHVMHTLQAKRIDAHASGVCTKEKATPADLKAAAWRLALGGACYDWSRFFSRKPAQAVDLPGYPWQMEEYPLPSSSEGGGLISNDKEHPLLGYRAHAKDWEWENHLDTLGMPGRADHQVGGSAVFPAAGFIEMALAAASLRHPGQTIQIEDFEIRTPLVLDGKHSKTVRLTFEENTGHFILKSRDRLSEDQWQPHAVGRISSQPARFQPEPPDALKKPDESIGAAEIYDAARMLGLNYGPAFQSLKSVSGNSNQLDSLLVLPEAVEINSESFLLHPSLLDGAFHSLFALLRRRSSDSSPQAFLPVRTDRFVLAQPGIKPTQVRTILRSHNRRSLLADFHLLDETGALVAWSTGWRFRSVQLVRRSFDRSQILRQEWIERPQPASSSILAEIENEISEILESVLSEIPEDSLLKRYPAEGDPLLDAMCASFILEAFRKLTNSRDIVSLDECLANGKVASEMEHYFRRLAALLVQDGLASEGPGTGEWKILDDAEVPSGQAICQSLVEDFPEKTSRFATAARVGMHLSEILDASIRIEELLPKLAQLASGAFYFPKSAVKEEAQEVLLQALQKISKKSPSAIGRILWVCGPRPSGERFVSPWMRDFPGLVNILLPGTAESEDVEGLLASYPGIKTATGAVSDEALGSLLEGDTGFDIIVAPPNLSSEEYSRLHSHLLPRGLLFCCLPEKSRYEDLIPMGGEAGLFSAENTQSTVARSFRNLQRVAISKVGESGPSILICVREALKQSQTNPQKRTLVLPLDAGCESLAEGLVSSLSTQGFSQLELLPPFDSEAAAVWEKLISDNHPDHLVFVASGMNGTASEPAQTTARELCAISACLRATAKVSPRTIIHIATQGAFSDDKKNNWMRSALWGFARVARNEFSELKIRCIDFPAAASESADSLANEIISGGSEDEVLLDGTLRMVRRVASGPQREKGNDSKNQRVVLDFDTPGPFQNLRWKFMEAPLPGRGELAIIPKAGGLNFRDVMYAMGLLPDEALEGGFAGQTLGMELSGVVAALGEGVEDFKVGDEVIAFAPSSFSSWTVTACSAVIHKPAGLSFAAAATIPAAFYTAYHALVELGGLKPGERVLIHGAAGGVGIAAIQIARHIGAEVFATAGNNDKRDFVRLIGADHVFNSRSLDFADAIRRETNGEGVDVVLNSLAGEAVSKNLEILRPFGRLLELGKRDFYENNRIGLRPFRHNIRYFAVDADQIMALRPDMAARGFRELLELFKNRSLAPLPMTVFPAAEVASAFRFMQHSNQTGKVVLDLSDIPSEASAHGTFPSAFKLRSDGTYLITGGWTGFGLETAKWLLSQGARSLAVFGRRGPSGDDAKKFLEECELAGAKIFSEPCDATDRAAVASALEKIRRTMAPLRGVFHAATVIDDALIVNMDVSVAAKVLAPKITAAAILDELTRKDPLDYFVLYSSATTFFGNPGQAVYVAANTALEELSAARRRAGRPSTCISWGPIGDTGYLSRHSQIKDALAARTGGQPLESADALRFLGLALANGTSQVAWLDMDWGAMARFLPSSNGPRFSMLSHMRGNSNSSNETSTDLRRELELLEPAELLETLKGLLKEEIGTILRVAPDKLDENRSLLEVGMDSLMGVELMSSLETNIGISIPIMALSEGPTIARLAERLSHAVRPPVGAEDSTEPSALAESVRHLASQHAADVSNKEIEELVAGIEGENNK